MSDELKELVNLSDNKIDTSDIPEVTDWSKAERGKFYRIKTAFFVDPVGSMGVTPEEEMQREKESLEDELGVKLDIHRVVHMGQIEQGTDLLLFDYGGMMMGNSLAEDNSRRVIQWAEDHPSALVVIISTFTYDHAVRDAIAEHLELETVPYQYSKPEGKQHETPIHNVVIESWRENFIPDWFRDAHHCKPYDDPWKGVKKTPEAEIEAEVRADIAKLDAPDDEEFIRSVEDKTLRKKKKPVTDKAEADAILALQKLDPKRNERVTRMIGALATRVVRPVLPAQAFFNPNKKFLTYMKRFRLRYVYDVGAGQGHVAVALRKAGIKKVNPIDLFPREGSVTKITFGDGTSYKFKANSLVMLCRPCHGMFPEATIENAIRRKADIMYVGLAKNVKNDLGDYYRKFKKVLSNVGEDKENIWVYQGK
jgi:hypothetical protein